VGVRSAKEQQLRINAGFHLLQTDYPWIQLNDKGYECPFRPLDSVRFSDPLVFKEPGQRIFVSPDSESVLNLITDDTISFWETLPSSTRFSPDVVFPNPFKSEGEGCLVASDINNGTSVSICRKVNLIQNAVITIKVTEDGKTLIKKYITNNRTSGLVGDFIALHIRRGLNSTESDVSFFSSSEMIKDSSGQLIPKWNLLLSKTINSSLVKQGISAADGAVLFVGTRRNGNNVSAQQLSK